MCFGFVLLMLDKALFNSSKHQQPKLNRLIAGNLCRFEDQVAFSLCQLDLAHLDWNEILNQRFITERAILIGADQRRFVGFVDLNRDLAFPHRQFYRRAEIFGCATVVKFDFEFTALDHFDRPDDRVVLVDPVRKI